MDDREMLRALTQVEQGVKVTDVEDGVALRRCIAELRTRIASPPRTWEPAPTAIARARTIAKLIDIDIHIDRYILRCRERDQRPTSQEWLRWLMDDEQKARTEERRVEQGLGPAVDDIGVPNGWSGA